MGWDGPSGDRARFPGPVGHHVDHDATREAFLGPPKFQSFFWFARVATKSLWMNEESGQIIATSHDLTPNGGLVREIRLMKYYNLARFMYHQYYSDSQ